MNSLERNALVLLAVLFVVVGGVYVFGPSPQAVRAAEKTCLVEAEQRVSLFSSVVKGDASSLASCSEGYPDAYCQSIASGSVDGCAGDPFCAALVSRDVASCGKVIDAVYRDVCVAVLGESAVGRDGCGSAARMIAASESGDRSLCARLEGSDASACLAASQPVTEEPCKVIESDSSVSVSCG